MVGTMMLTILPWSFHNLAATGEFILINDAAGYNLWLGNHPAALRLHATPAGPSSGERSSRVFTEKK